MISSFVGKFRFLSNFEACPKGISFDGNLYPTLEHAYQAAKSLDEVEREKIRGAVSPNHAKSMGGRITLRPDWTEIRLDIMEDLLRRKFREGSELAKKLLETGDEVLIEGNWWGDTFWGKCNGRGENNLGKLLMTIRGDLRERSEQNQSDDRTTQGDLEKKP